MNDEQALIELANNVKLVDVYTEMFRKGDFSFIVEGTAKNSEGEFEIGEQAKHLKQERALQILTDNEYEEFLYGGAAGGAKAQPLDAKIYTPFGYKTMGDVKVGDVIKHPSGGNTNVIAIHPQGKKKIYEVTFIDGAKTKCCGDHLWKVWYSGKLSKQEKRNGKGKVQTTEMLIKNLHRKPIIPLSDPLEFNLPVNKYTKTVWSKINSYVLGCLIGDGGLTKQIGFTSCDEEIVKYISERIDNRFSINKLKQEYSYSITQDKRNEKGHSVNELYDVIKQLGLNCKSEFKFLPESFLHAPLKERIEITQGLMDTDGTIDERGHCSYSTSSKKLALDFQYVLRSLGFKVTMSEEKTTHLNTFRLYIQGNNCDLLFKLKRKKERVKKFNGGFSESGRRILSIEEVGYEEAKCITVDALDSLYVTDDFIVTHNTWTGASWIAFMCKAYPGTSWFIARNQLKDLLGSVFKTFKKVCKEYEITGWKFNAQKNYIEFENGSFIDLIEVAYKPSDPMYEDLGSTEYTGGWIEEIGEIHEMAAIVLGTRIGRHMNSELGIKKKLFMTCNPKRNWGKTKFYDKDKNGSLYEENKIPLENGRKRIQRIYLNCLVTENPFIDQDYIDGLMAKALDHKPTYERLFKGNWDYEENPYQLALQEMIDIIYENDQVPEGKGYITADVARFGSDKARIGYWSGWRLKHVISLDISKTTDVELAINTLRMKYRVPKTRLVIDQDGVGGGVVDGTGGQGFKNNGRPIKIERDMPNYKNLQVQCLYTLADMINDGNLYIEADLTSDEKEQIKEELTQIQSKGEQDPERKLDCKSKGDIKQDIGRSPDWRDMIMMRVYFDLKPQKRALIRRMEG